VILDAQPKILFIKTLSHSSLQLSADDQANLPCFAFSVITLDFCALVLRIAHRYEGGIRETIPEVEKERKQQMDYTAKVATDCRKEVVEIV